MAPEATLVHPGTSPGALLTAQDPSRACYVGPDKPPAHLTRNRTAWKTAPTMKRGHSHKLERNRGDLKPINRKVSGHVRMTFFGGL
jgi:hypothetical protein